MIVPPRIRPKDQVVVVSPAGRIEIEPLRKGLRILRAWGLEVHTPQENFEACRYLAGRDERRARLLAKCWGSFDILWASRGGYGSLRLLTFFDDLLTRPEKPFWFIGFSDVSILLNYFYGRFELITLHAPVLSSLYETSVYALAALKNCLFYEARIRLGGKGLKPGEARGPLIGGNLTSLVSLIGTPWQPNFEGKILFLEEVNEPPYRVDRLFTQLALTGAFRGIKGLVLGDFGEVPLAVLKEIAGEYFEGPILAEVPAGHSVDNYPLFIGAETTLKVGPQSGCLEQGPLNPAP